MKKHEHFNVKQKFVGIELEALSALLGRWATPAEVKRKGHLWSERMSSLRMAVLAGLAPAGKRDRAEDVAHEVVEDDYLTVREAVIWMRKQVGAERSPAKRKHQLLTGCVPTALDIDRPFPAPERLCDQLVSDLANKAVPPSTIARYITAERLRVAPDTVRNAVKKVRVLGKPIAPRRAEHRVLASMLLDMASFPGVKAQRCRDRIFEALLTSRYPSIVLYYLTQACHRIPSEISMRPYDAKSIEAACSTISEAGADYQSSEPKSQASRRHGQAE